MQNREETGPYIWLRYTTQFQRDGQTHTIEMSVPVPVGASAEQREQLIHEAEAGMTQMVQHMGQRLPQVLPAPSLPNVQEQVLPPGGKGQEIASSGAPPSRPTPLVGSQVTTPLPRVRETRPDSGSYTRPSGPLPRQEEVEVPPTRPNIGASMPMELGPTLDSSGNLSISDFLKYLRENLSMDAKQAMHILNVKTLQGVNLREALDRIKIVAIQRNTASGQARSASGGETKSDPAPRTVPQSATVSGTANANGEKQPGPDTEEEEDEERIIELSVPPRGFDEEESEPGEPEPDEEELPDYLRQEQEFAPHILGQAREKINQLREHQGASVASTRRLQVLHNVADTQVHEEQLQELISGIWNIPTLKKLKVDQVEALISWAKQDDFVEEAKAMLFLLEEERYARGNR